MTTSGSTSFSVSRNDIVRSAYLKAKAVDANATISSIMMADGVRSLNSMMARWRKTGVHIWKLEEITLFPQAGQRRYNISTASPDHVALAYSQTTISSSEAAAQTVLSVSSVVGMTIGDQIGILLDSGSIFWSTISAVGATTVTIAAPLPSAASTGAYVWRYTSANACAVDRPVGIGRGQGAVRRHDFTSLIDTPIGPCMARADYDALPNKDGPGVFNLAYYDQQLTVGYISLWQVPATVQHLCKITAQLPIEYFVNATNNPDLPAEWIDALVYNLAVMFAPEYNVPADKFSLLKTEAGQYLADIATEDREGESFFMQPDYQ